MKEYYMLLGLNQKEVKIMNVKENNGIIEVSIENKNKAKIEVREVVKFVEKIDTLYIEKPVPYEVEKKVRYVPSIYKLSLIFMIAAIALTIIRLILKHKFKI